MASSVFEIVGPWQVKVCLPDDAAGTYVELGYCPNSDPPSFDEEIHTIEESSMEYGDEAEQIIYTGARGVLQFTLNRWIEATLNELLIKVRPNTTAPDGQFGLGNIGVPYVGATRAASFMFGIQFLPPGTTGLAKRSFPSCYLAGTAVRQFNFGNQGTRTSFTCQVRRSAAEAGVYTGTSPAESHELLNKGVTA